MHNSVRRFLKEQFDAMLPQVGGECRYCGEPIQFIEAAWERWLTCDPEYTGECRGPCHPPSICEIGSYNVNGSAREFAPTSTYIGIDVRPGPDVDVIADVSTGCLDIMEGMFDVVVCVETLEHARDWKGLLRRCKAFLRERGTLLLTARGPGFPRHDHPGDYWRFTVEDMEHSLRDMSAANVFVDPQAPGFLAVCKKPLTWNACSIDVAPMRVT